jgi:hypothetical protein
MIRTLLLSLVLLAITSSASAQNLPNYDAKPDAFWQALEIQMYRSLAENVDGIAPQQLRNIVIFRSLYADRLDLSESVPVIIRLHRTSRNDEIRALAVAALQAINTFEARSYVRNRVSRSESDAARLVARDALVEALANFPLARR